MAKSSSLSYAIDTGLAYRVQVTRITGTPTTSVFCIGLSGRGDNCFVNTDNPYFVFVMHAGVGNVAPQGEMQPVTGYVSQTGQITFAALTAPLAVGDVIIVLQASQASIFNLGQTVIYYATTGISGSAFPAGTAATPVNNTADLRSLLTTYPWIKTVVVLDSIAFTAGYSFQGIEFLGVAPSITSMTALTITTELDNSQFEAMNININGITATLNTYLYFTNVGDVIITNPARLCFRINGALSVNINTGTLGATTATSYIKNVTNTITLYSLLVPSSLVNVEDITGAITIGIAATVGTGITGTWQFSQTSDIYIYRVDSLVASFYISQMKAGAAVSVTSCPRIANLDITGYLFLVSSQVDTLRVNGGTNLIALTTTTTTLINGSPYNNISDLVGGTVNIYNVAGAVAITSCTHAGAIINVYGNNAQPISIAVTNTAGTANLYGFATLTNLTGGMTVNNYLYSFAATDAGVLQQAATTISLNQAAATYTLFTGTTQVVELESLVFAMPDTAAGGALTSISIQTDDTTNQVIIDTVTGAVANLTRENQLGWTGRIRIGAGKRIRLTIAGGATGFACTANVNAQYRAAVAGGTLA